MQIPVLCKVSKYVRFKKMREMNWLSHFDIYKLRWQKGEGGVHKMSIFALGKGKG